MAAAAAAVPPPIIQVQKLRDPLPPNPLPDPPAINLHRYNDLVNQYRVNELAIINQNVSQLVELIKRKLGNTNQNVNVKVAGIVNTINRAMNQINLNHMQYLENRIIARNATTDDAQVKDIGTLNNLQHGLVLPNFQTLQTHTRREDSQQYTNDATNPYTEAIVSVRDPATGNPITINMSTLNSQPGDSTITTDFINPDTDITVPANLTLIQNRLINCQRLEMLYLMKHEELMKTFVFTLNLFDKYQYSIKLLLFVLKNLVYKTGPRPPINIQLPKPLIRNIKELLKDQQKMQDVITQMRNVVNTNDIRDISSPTSTRPSSADLAAGHPGGTLMDVGTPP